MRVGDVVGGSLRVDAHVATGGMGAVYRATDLRTGDPVAIKTLALAGEEARRRFGREVRVLAEITHDAVVRHVAHGETDGGERWLAMEWIEGEDLATRLFRGPLSLPDALAIATRLVDALGAAHDRGIIHRDVKPSNIMLVGGDPAAAKLLDFGIAKARHLATQATRTGASFGTPAYMAPEQVRGDHRVGPPADLFAVGCVIFEMLTGRPAFSGEHIMAILARVLLEEAPRLCDVRPVTPRVLGALVARLLAKDAEARPASAAEVHDALDRIPRVEEGVTAPSLPPAVAEQILFAVVFVAPGGGLDGARAASAGLDDTLTAGADLAISRLEEVASAHRGRLDRLGGGAAMMSFSGAAAATDLAAHAARSALASLLAYPNAHVALAVGLGVAYGTSLAGPVIERASALLASTLAGDVAVDTVAAGLLTGFEIAERDGRLVLTGERSLSGARRVVGKEPPCLGRDRELATLGALVEESTDEPAARAALLVAPPGMGKSRLVYEAMRRAGPGRGGEVWLGRADAVGAGSAFALVAGALRSTAGFATGDAFSLRRERLVARVSRSVSAAEASRVATFLGELVGTNFPGEGNVELLAARSDPVLLGDQMRRAFLDFLGAELERGPVTLVFEDVHWGDRPSLGFVDAALRAFRQRPLFVLASARPEITTTFPDLWSARGVQLIRLGELNARAARGLVAAVLGELPRDLVDRWIEVAGGNPLYLEELMRAHAGGRSGALPETLLAMVHARFETLEPDARRVLRAASVLGERFWSSAVASILGVEAPADLVRLEAVLAELEDHEWVTSRGSSRFPPERELAFRHAAHRDAAYASFAKRDLGPAHGQAARWLERAGETDAAALAEHQERAGDDAAASASWLRSARESLEGSDHANTVARAARGLARASDDAAKSELWCVTAQALWLRGDLDRAADAAESALAHAPRFSTVWLRAVTAFAGSRARISDPRVEALVATGFEHDLAADLADAAAAALATCCAQLALVAKHEAAARVLARLEALSAGHPSPLARAWTSRARSVEATARADPARALAFAAAAAQAFAEAGDMRSAAYNGNTAAFSRMCLGDYERAAADFERSAADCRALGLDFMAAVADHNLGLVYAALGACAKGRALEMQALEFLEMNGGGVVVSTVLVYLAQIELLDGQPERAAEAARRAGAEADAAPERAMASAVLARALVLLGKIDEAYVEAAAAHATLLELGTMEEAGTIVRVAFAEALVARGELGQARRVIEDGIREIEATAKTVHDTELRRSFLERVPENRALFELGRRLSEG